MRMKIFIILTLFVSAVFMTGVSTVVAQGGTVTTPEILGKEYAIPVIKTPNAGTKQSDAEIQKLKEKGAFFFRGRSYDAKQVDFTKMTVTDSIRYTANELATFRHVVDSLRRKIGVKDSVLQASVANDFGKELDDMKTMIFEGIKIPAEEIVKLAGVNKRFDEVEARLTVNEGYIDGETLNRDMMFPDGIPLLVEFKPLEREANFFYRNGKPVSNKIKFVSYPNGDGSRSVYALIYDGRAPVESYRLCVDSNMGDGAMIDGKRTILLAPLRATTVRELAIGCLMPGSLNKMSADALKQFFTKNQGARDIIDRVATDIAKFVKMPGNNSR